MPLQDLLQASLDRARLERYLTLVREASQEDSADLQQRTNLLARSLGIKVDQSCFEKPTAQQLQCLTKNSSQLVLDDAHTQSMVDMLTSGSLGRPADANHQHAAHAGQHFRPVCRRGG